MPPINAINTTSRWDGRIPKLLLYLSEVVQIEQVLKHSRAKLPRKQLNLPLGPPQFVNGLGAETFPARILYRVRPRGGGQFAAVWQRPHEALFAVVRPRRCREFEWAHLGASEGGVNSQKKKVMNDKVAIRCTK